MKQEYTQRQKKVNVFLQEILSEIFRKQVQSNFKNILITVSEVRITVDFSIAKVYLSIFPPNAKQDIFEEIKESTTAYRRLLGQELKGHLRVVPELIFYLDDSLDKIEDIDRELRGEGGNPFLD